jgi:hypothetical protein
VNAPWQAEESLHEAVNRARHRPDALVEPLAVDARTSPGLWQVHGALLTHLDRLLYEIDPQAGTEAGGARRDTVKEPWMTAMRRVTRQGAAAASAAASAADPRHRLHSGRSG